MRDIEKKTESPERATAIAASSLLGKIDHSRNRLVDDGKRLTDSIGVEMATVVRNVHYSKKTGRVTVAWEIRTAGFFEAVKLAIVAPPDDVKKREATRRMLVREPERVKDALEWFAKRGVNMEPWWTEGVRT